MSNPTSVIDFTDDLAGFLARTNQFGEKNQDLVQQKRNKSPGDGTSSPGFPATESTAKSVAQWPNMVDDFQLRWADWTGGQSTLGFAGSLQKFTLGVSLGLATARGGTGDPEGVVTAGVGSIFLRTDGAVGTTLYTKETGAGNTGWSAFESGGVFPGNVFLDSASPSLTIGDGTGTPSLIFNRDAAGASGILFLDGGTPSWTLTDNPADDFVIAKTGGSAVLTLDQATSLATWAADVTVEGDSFTEGRLVAEAGLNVAPTILTSTPGRMALADVNTDTTNKFGYIVSQQYTNSHRFLLKN